MPTVSLFFCGNADLDDFFQNDATRYAYYLMGKTYCFRLNSDSSKIVCALTVSNDSIRIYDLPRSRRDYMKSLTHCAHGGCPPVRKFKEKHQTMALFL